MKKTILQPKNISNLLLSDLSLLRINLLFSMLFLALCTLAGAQEANYENEEYVIDVKFSRAGEGNHHHSGHGHNDEKLAADIVDINVMDRKVRNSWEGDTFFFSLKAKNKELHKIGAQIALTGHIPPTQDVDFELIDDHFPLDSVTQRIQLPYDPTADTIEITSKWGEVKIYNIGDFTCNKDNHCDFGENFVTCSSDCEEGSDGICVNKIDGICDPDCDNDYDCKMQEREEKENKREASGDAAEKAGEEKNSKSKEIEKEQEEKSKSKGRSSMKIILIVLTAVIVIAVVVLIFMMKKGGNKENYSGISQRLKSVQK